MPFALGEETQDVNRLRNRGNSNYVAVDNQAAVPTLNYALATWAVELNLAAPRINPWVLAADVVYNPSHNYIGLFSDDGDSECPPGSGACTIVEGDIDYFGGGYCEITDADVWYSRTLPASLQWNFSSIISDRCNVSSPTWDVMMIDALTHEIGHVCGAGHSRPGLAQTAEYWCEDYDCDGCAMFPTMLDPTENPCTDDFGWGYVFGFSFLKTLSQVEKTWLENAYQGSVSTLMDIDSIKKFGGILILTTFCMDSDPDGIYFVVNVDGRRQRLSEVPIAPIQTGGRCVYSCSIGEMGLTEVWIELQSGRLLGPYSVEMEKPAARLPMTAIVVPNPIRAGGSGFLHTNAEMGAGPLEVRVSDIAGRTVLLFSSAAQQLELPQLSSGVYVIHVDQGNNRAIAKCVVIN